MVQKKKIQYNFQTIEEMERWVESLIPKGVQKYQKCVLKCITKVGDPVYLEKVIIQNEILKVEIGAGLIYIQEIQDLWEASDYGRKYRT